MRILIAEKQESGDIRNYDENKKLHGFQRSYYSDGSSISSESNWIHGVTHGLFKFQNGGNVSYTFCFYGTYEGEYVVYSEDPF